MSERVSERERESEVSISKSLPVGKSYYTVGKMRIFFVYFCKVRNFIPTLVRVVRKLFGKLELK